MFALWRNLLQQLNHRRIVSGTHITRAVRGFLSRCRANYIRQRLHVDITISNLDSIRLLTLSVDDVFSVGHSGTRTVHFVRNEFDSDLLSLLHMDAAQCPSGCVNPSVSGNHAITFQQ